MSKIAILGNADKERIKSESWHDKDRTLSCIPHPCRILYLGRPGCGKTNLAKNLFLQHQLTKNPFKELIIVSPDTSDEWLDAQPTMVINDLPGAELFDVNKKTLLVIDDYELTGLNQSQRKKLSTLFRYVSSHCNVSIYMSFQSALDCPNIARKCCNVFCLWAGSSKLERSLICNRVGLNKGMLDHIFKNHCTDDFDSVMIDRSIGSPAMIRKNVYEPLDEEVLETEMKKMRVKELRDIREEAKLSKE